MNSDVVLLDGSVVLAAAEDDSALSRVVDVDGERVERVLVDVGVVTLCEVVVVRATVVSGFVVEDDDISSSDVVDSAVELTPGLDELVSSSKVEDVVDTAVVDNSIVVLLLSSVPIVVTTATRTKLRQNENLHRLSPGIVPSRTPIHFVTPPPVHKKIPAHPAVSSHFSSHGCWLNLTLNKGSSLITLKS